ncbi:BN860_05204g1_1 [Zygosaccharomyces bailii CLIB 213]|uniref:BN860_05204g1_1 n=1 Tax=Zygosaccharomyces bailii (strain CLIB 213 / ATCC 58445 / CBS 680 / BCRC 21525 / NBRC 1098 / NCYC 1416 / NRRL Y-2227) TaxID=1333698 RepID=A0A8J2T4L8_ZYGB2|nr:BN860_05204g1_1 [Zygosaccharomyces bailii CLIB 213]
MLSVVPLYFLLAICSASHLLDLQRQFNSSDVDISHLGLSSNDNNALELLGGCQDFSFYRYTGQENFTRPLSSTTDSKGLIYYSNNTFLQLANGFNDTEIKHIVALGRDSFILGGTGRLEGHELENQLLYNLTDNTFKPIFRHGLTNINSILVDGSLVYFGGDFSYSNESDTGHSAILWDSEQNSTSLLPFLGFGKNSSVNSIVKLDNDNILFAGKFYELDKASLLENQPLSNSSRSSNWTDVELGLAIPLQNANWTYGQSKFNTSGFVCPNSAEESWLQYGTSGSLSCTLPQESTPNKVRIYNSPIGSDEISLFRIITSPSQGIMNLTYVDPETGETRYCDAFCPLYNREKLKQTSANSSSAQHMTTFTKNNTTDIKWGRDFQEFAFVNDIAISSVEFFALSSYGENVGLSSFQLFQSSPSIYANNSLNKPACDSMKSYSEAKLSNNDWKQGLDGQTYLSTEYIPGKGDKPKVVFYPHIQYPGDYIITLYTPGCLGDGTCSQRAIVNVTLWDGDTNEPLSTGTVYENNNELKYNELYSGHLNSSPRVTLEYYSSIYPNNPSSVVVADYISIVAKSIDNFRKSNLKNITLNGLFQYQLSNFTHKTLINHTEVGNTPLNQFPLANFAPNSSIFASLYDNTTLLLADANTSAIKVKLDKEWNITSSAKYETDMQIKGIGSYSKGLVLFGSDNISANHSTALSFDGGFTSLDKINKSIESFVNLTLHESELIVFGNEFVYNVSSGGYTSNSTIFSLSVWSAGQNAYGDLIFSGAVSTNDFSTLNGPFHIFQNGSLKSVNNLGEHFNPYLGTHLNDTLTAYAYKDGSHSSLVFSNAIKGDWEWPHLIQSMLYSNKDTVLAIGTASSSYSSQLTLLNLTTFKMLANETFNEGTDVSTMILFDKDATLLVGGSFSIPEARCHGLCLFNYKSKTWSSFANGTINGNVSEIQLHNTTELLISGSFKVQNSSNVNLASLQITGERIRPLLAGWKEPLKSFIVSGNTLIAWNATNLVTYDNSSWKDVPIPISDSSPGIKDVKDLQLQQSQTKRDLSSSGSKALLVYGAFREEQNNAYQGLIYDYDSWEPFFMVNFKGSDSNSKPNLFMNKNFSDLYISEETLLNQNTTRTSSLRSSSTTLPPLSKTSTASSIASSSPSDKAEHHHKVDRGFVVLIGLALAVGTVAAIGIIGVLVAYIFGADIGEYEFLNPPSGIGSVNGTAPPEKLP